MNNITTILCMACLLVACKTDKLEQQDRQSVETVSTTSPNKVSVIQLQPSTFNHELVSNGKVTATEYVDLYFRNIDVVEKIWVRNGSRVRKGQEIAQLNLYKLKNTLQQQKNALAKATLDMQDVLIGQGYNPSLMEAVPADVLQLAKVRSGYNQIKARCELAQNELDKATLVAPFDGVVVNMFGKKYNISKTSTAFCRILNDNAMEVDFTVLESELSLIKIGDYVEVFPYAATTGKYTGKISEINPFVNANGMVRIKALVNNGKHLFDGMNVRIHVKREVAQQLIVPKTAVVLRNGKQVVFTYKDGHAEWHYIHTGLENMLEYTITNGLDSGTEVITTGNLNLTHESPVCVVNR